VVVETAAVVAELGGRNHDVSHRIMPPDASKQESAAFYGSAANLAKETLTRCLAQARAADPKQRFVQIIAISRRARPELRHAAIR
jgi:hypothetical protein